MDSLHHNTLIKSKNSVKALIIELQKYKKQWNWFRDIWEILVHTELKSCLYIKSSGLFHNHLSSNTVGGETMLWLHKIPPSIAALNHTSLSWCKILVCHYPNGAVTSMKQEKWGSHFYEEQALQTSPGIANKIGLWSPVDGLIKYIEVYYS